MNNQQVLGYGVPLRRRARGHTAYPFGSLRELAMESSRYLDKAREVDLYRIADGHTPGETDPTFSYIPRYKAIENVNLQALATVVSKDYYLVQHEQAITYAIEGLANRNIEGFGILHNGRNAAAAEILFSNYDGDNHGYEVGVRLENSFNKTTAVKGMIYLEIKRDNTWYGMAFANIIPGGSFYARHSAQLQQTLPSMIARFIDALDPSLSYIDNLITFAIQAQIDFPNEQSLILTLGSAIGNQPRAGDIIANEWAGNLTMTRWDLFEMVLRYMKNQALPYGLYMSLSAGAEQIININRPLIPILPRPTEGTTQVQPISAA